MSLPTIEASENINTGPNAALGPAEGITGFGEKAGTLLGQGIEHVGLGLERYAIYKDRSQRHLDALAKQHTAQDENLEVNTKTSQLRNDWTTQLQNLSDNPTTDALPKTVGAYDEYADNLIKTGSSKRVQDELNIRAQEFRVQVMNHAHSIQTQARQAEFGASFNGMMSNAEDSIFASKDVSELMNQKKILNDTIDGAIQTGRIKDPETIQSLRSKADLLGVSWAEANVADNPDMVKDVINGKFKGAEHVFDGVPIQHREVLLDKADRVIKTNEDYHRIALRQQLESDIVQRIKTGDGESLNLDQYQSIYGKEARAAAESELNDATRLHSVTESVKGADMATLQKTLNDSQPKADPKDSTYGQQQRYFEQVQQVVQQAAADKKDDAFTYYANNPALKSLVEDATRENTKKKGQGQIDVGSMSDAAQQNLRHAVLNMQKMDKSLSPNDYAVMPKADAQAFIERFNGLTEVGNMTDGAGVRDLLSHFADQYKDSLPIALNQLSKVKGGDAVTPLINPLMWHLNNPSTFRLTLDALRKDPKEQMDKFASEKEGKNFLADAKLDGNFLAYRNSMQAANNSPETQSLVNGVQKAYTAFARDYVLNGGKMKDASSVFFQNYTWGTVNGATYARPRNYTDHTGVQHVMSDEQIRLSNNYMEWYPKSIAADTIDPSTAVNQTKYFNSKELSKDVSDALQRNSFWSTTGDETGAYLYVKGAINGTSKQVKDKQGNPIRVNFIDTMKPTVTEPAGFRTSAKTTADHWYDFMAHFDWGS